MKVLVDKYIPFLSGILEPYAEVGYLGEDEFTHERIKDANALIIRTTVHCDRILLEGTSVRFIATATIGFDHIDTSYCISHGVHVCSCPGCNAEAVCDYVEEAVNNAQQGLSINYDLMAVKIAQACARMNINVDIDGRQLGRIVRGMI